MKFKFFLKNWICLSQAPTKITFHHYNHITAFCAVYWCFLTLFGFWANQYSLQLFHILSTDPNHHHSKSVFSKKCLTGSHASLFKTGSVQQEVMQLAGSHIQVLAWSVTRQQPLKPHTNHDHSLVDLE